MRQYCKSVLLILLGLILGFSFSFLIKNFKAGLVTEGYRELEMKVNIAGHDMMIWKTVIAPQKDNEPGIAMHRHEYARVLIPLTQGVLQRRDADGSTTDYLLEIGKPLLLPEDTADGFHTDENLGKMPLEIMVLQFTQSQVRAEQLTAQHLQGVVDIQ